MEVKLVGRIESVNQGSHFCNITIVNEFNKAINIKLKPEELELIIVGKAYEFITHKESKDTKEFFVFDSCSLIEHVLDIEELDRLLPIFYKYAPISPKELIEGIEGYLSLIENDIIKTITTDLYNMYKNEFYVHSAATKLHHAYAGGLAYHTLTMLKLSSPFIEIYPYLNKDLIYSGIILHDMSKIKEITGADGEYTKEGQLIGHLVMIAIEIEKIALKYNYENSEEVLLLKHIVLAHHGVLNYGSPKKPQVGEALLIWFLDTIDSKFTPLQDAYEEIEPGSFTTMLQVLDRMKFYKDEL